MINKITLTGTIAEVKPDYTFRGTEYSNIILGVQRLSEVYDMLPITFEKIKGTEFKLGDLVKFEGEIRTKNVSETNIDGIKKRLKVFAQGKLEKLDQSTYSGMLQDINLLEIEGFICHKLELRETRTRKSIIDFRLAHNSNYNNYYIPMVCFNNLAKKIANFELGSKLYFTGRFQSRQYQKSVGQFGDFENKVAYEIVAISFKKGEETISNE